MSTDWMTSPAASPVAVHQPPGLGGPTLRTGQPAIGKRPYRLLSDAERREWLGRRVGWACWGNLALVTLLLLLICYVSEGWWVSAALTYLPRVPYLLPSIPLFVLAAIYRRDLCWTPLVAMGLVLGPIMGFSAPTGTAAVPASGEKTLRLLSVNLQEGTGGPLRVFQEIEQMRPDVVVIQETLREIDGLDEQFADWQTVHVGEFFVASKFPISLVGECETQAFDRRTAIVCRVESPEGPFLVGNVHLNTVRHGLGELRLTSFVTGEGVEDFSWHQWTRRQEAAETEKFLHQYAELPLLVAGDFNAPTTSSMFTEHWSEWQSAFETAGMGYGYTVPCNTSHLWPQNTPWARVDHILTSPHWGVVSCRIGTGNGSDHRLIVADFVRMTH
ncbi:MAG: endonuclease/exonuclease/phosphatase family protein [Planctomycetaceae bacterium]